jgi:hypothetical protein
MFRRVMKDFTLSDGTVLPAGTEICFANGPMNKDEVRIAFYHVFDGLNADSSLVSGLSPMHIRSKVSGLLKCVMVMGNLTVSNIRWFP